MPSSSATSRGSSSAGTAIPISTPTIPAIRIVTRKAKAEAVSATSGATRDLKLSATSTAIAPTVASSSSGTPASTRPACWARAGTEPATPTTWSSGESRNRSM